MRNIQHSVLVLLLVGTPLVAQESAGVLPRDARVRVWSTRYGLSERQGRVVRLGSDSLQVMLARAPSRQVTIIPISAIERVDRFERRWGANRFAGSMTGGVLMTIVGAAAGYAFSPCRMENNRRLGHCWFGPGPDAIATGVIAGGVGFVVGGVVGYPESRWVAVDLTRK